MNALIRQSIRRWRHWLERKHWQMTRRFRQPPREVVAIDPLIVQARKAHKRVKPLHEKRREMVNEQLRKGLMQ